MRETRAVPAEREEAFLNLIQVAFRMRRKTLVNGLASGLGISKEQIAGALAQLSLRPDVRGETLELEQFAALANLLLCG